MTEKAMDGLKQNLEASTYCPLTGVQVLEYGSKQFSISDLHITWWNCPACGGWHILTTKMKREKDNVTVEPSYQPLSF